MSKGQNEVFGYDVSEDRVSQVCSEHASLGKQYIVTKVSLIASANVYIIMVLTPTDQQNKLHMPSNVVGL